MKPRISMRAALSDNALLGAVLAGSSPRVAVLHMLPSSE